MSFGNSLVEIAINAILGAPKRRRLLPYLLKFLDGTTIGYLIKSLVKEISGGFFYLILKKFLDNFLYVLLMVYKKYFNKCEKVLESSLRTFPSKNV